MPSQSKIQNLKSKILRAETSIVGRMSFFRRLCAHGLLLVLCIPFVLPLVWMLSTSLKPNEQIYAREGTQPVVSVKGLIPNPPKWSNYSDAVKTVPLGTYLRNTLYLCVANVIGAVLSSAVVAYGFARIRFRGRETLFMLMIGTMALPGQVTMIPVFALFKYLGWYGTFLPLIVPAFCGSAFYIFLLRQFFRTIPQATLDAARIDGCGHFGTFWHVVLPMSKPALATVAIFTFMGSWNDFLAPLVYLNTKENYTLAVGLALFRTRAEMVDITLLMAASLVVLLPCVIVFFICQRLFIQGVVVTGVK